MSQPYDWTSIARMTTIQEITLLMLKRRHVQDPLTNTLTGLELRKTGVGSYAYTSNSPHYSCPGPRVRVLPRDFAFWATAGAINPALVQALHQESFTCISPPKVIVSFS